MKTYYVYILSNESKTSLYIGVTSNLIKRIEQHKGKEIDGFTKKYNINRLVYYESTNNIKAAIEREKCIKAWKREWKENLINTNNPAWEDLSLQI